MSYSFSGFFGLALNISMALPTFGKTTLFDGTLWISSKQRNSGIKDISEWPAKAIEFGKPQAKGKQARPARTAAAARAVVASKAIHLTSSRPSSSKSSALSNGIKITGLEDDDDDDECVEKGAISDCDETVGEEYEAKKVSPVKGKVRISSKVSIAIPSPFERY